MKNRANATQGARLNRRHFLKTTALLGTVLVVELNLPGCATTGHHTANPGDWEADAWLSLDPNGQITFVLDRVEMGQGTMTGLTTLIAEELNVSPATIKVVAARADRRYANPDFGIQITGGSTSLKAAYLPLRQAAAAMRMALVNAAATIWHVDANQIIAEAGRVIHGDRSMGYGELIHEAARLGLPEEDEIQLKTPDQFRYIGKPGARLDAQMKVLGTGTFGIDVQRPVLYKAALKRCPVPGATLKSWHDTGASKRPGIKRVIAIDTGVAVIAENWWQAQQALSLIEIEWDDLDLNHIATERVFATFAQAAKDESGKKVRSEGDGADALDDATTVLDVEYRAPYLAHATLEPQNCTVELSSDFCEIWAPTQGPDVVAAWAENITGLSRSRIEVHTTLIGGGFGRRLTQDFAIEAVKIAKACGLPIQLIWSRQDDIQHDVYRPAALARMRAGFDHSKQLTVCAAKVVTPSIMANIFGHMAGAVLPAAAPDWAANAAGSMGPLYGTVLEDPSCTEGIADTLYGVPNLEVRHIVSDPGVPVGYWRSVGHSYTAFFMESFIDELAHHTGEDPVVFRRRLLADSPRMLNVLNVLAEKGQWGNPTPGRFQGLAIHKSFASYVGQIAEISIENGKIRVHHVTCVVDCGMTITPDIVVAQMEGGVQFGLAAALYGEITHSKGAVVQSGFQDYPLLRMQEAPTVDVHLIASHEPPTGVGEPGVPPIAPAVANAVFAATSHRLRSLPLRLTS